tara:strand:- start:273 stop:407 length:135 start_codon:yes stop_codon:yes gene_type:complete
MVINKDENEYNFIDRRYYTNTITLDENYQRRTKKEGRWMWMWMW